MRIYSESISDNIEETQQVLKLDLPVAPTVLIVEDDALVLARLQELVKIAGYSVRTASSGAEALEVLAECEASIVVSDLSMPGMDGLSLCRRIREQAWPRYVYVVLLTVRTSEADILAGLEAGADDYLSKRTSAAQFTARLQIAKRVLSLEYSLKTALDKTHQLAMTDALTGVYNVRYFRRHLGRELKRSQRFGGNLSVLLIDIDHFKAINDTYGHITGDLVLKKLTRRIGKSLLRSTDWCARVGGEEFAVVLEGTTLQDACACAEKVRSAIAEAAIKTSVGAISIRVSIGVSALDSFAEPSAVSIQSLLEHADRNLYASKADGRDRVTSTPASAWENHADQKIAVGAVRR